MTLCRTLALAAGLLLGAQSLAKPQPTAACPHPLGDFGCGHKGIPVANDITALAVEMGDLSELLKVYMQRVLNPPLTDILVDNAPHGQACLRGKLYDTQGYTIYMARKSNHYTLTHPEKLDGIRAALALFTPEVKQAFRLMNHDAPLAIMNGKTFSEKEKTRMAALLEHPGVNKNTEILVAQHRELLDLMNLNLMDDGGEDSLVQYVVWGLHECHITDPAHVRPQIRDRFLKNGIPAKLPY